MIRFYFFAFFLFFSFSAITHAADSDMVINEIAAAEKSDHEWFEIYNKGTTTIDITGWKVLTDATTHKINAFRGDLIIDPGEYVVIADNAANTKADYQQFTGTLIDSSWASLLNDGMLLGLQNSKGDIIEFFIYQAMKKYSLERKDPLKNDYLLANWQEHAIGNTIGVQNSNYSQIPLPSPQSTPQPLQQQEQIQLPLSPPPSPTPQIPQGSSPAQQLIIRFRGDVVINEFVSDPLDEEEEWIELVNTTQKEVALSDWTLEDGSKRKVSLNGTLGIADTKRFFVVEVGSGMLNNAGDKIILRDNTEQIIDEVSFGNWNDGDTTNNAPAPRDPFSCARAGDGVNTFHNKNDFKITTTSTRGSSNKITEDKAFIEEKKEERIIISEILPNPRDKDVQNEFIELQNIGKDAVDIDNWEIEVSSGRKFTIQNGQGIQTIMMPGYYVVFPRSITGLPLRNKGGDTISLFKQQKTTPVTRLSYRGAAEEGQSYAFDTRGKYQWTLQSTPGTPNSIVLENKEPIIVIDPVSQGTVGQEILFDASDTHDPDNDSLVFLWNFGDGVESVGISPKHVYVKDGSYKVLLRVSDGNRWVKETVAVKIKKILEQQEQKDEQKISIQANPEKQEQKIVLAYTAIDQEKDKEKSSQLLLNEIFPNPKGSDTGEFIEVINNSLDPADLEKYSLHMEGAKKDIFFPKKILESQDFFVLTKNEFPFSLRNTHESISLLYRGQVVDSIQYDDAPIASSLSRINDTTWIWTNAPTPGEENEVPQLKDEDEKEIENATVQFSLQTRTKQKKNVYVSVKGTVSVGSGSLGRNLFYLTDPPLAVYVSKDMVNVTAGDIVEIRGNLSTRSGVERLTVSRKEDIKIITHAAEPLPSEMSLSDITENDNNRFIKVKGEVSEIRWPYLTLIENEDELQVSLRAANMKKKDVRIGDVLAVSGIIASSSRGLRLSPTKTQDVAVVEHKKGEKDDFEYLPENKNEKEQFLQYGIITFITLLVIGAGYFIKKKYSF